jgi:hypothetical protein
MRSPAMTRCDGSGEIQVRPDWIKADRMTGKHCPPVIIEDCPGCEDCRCSDCRPFPLQADRGLENPIRTIPWHIAEKAYADYSRKFGTDQTLKHLGERGGFGNGEMDMFLPGWRDMIDDCFTCHGLGRRVKDE